MRKTVTTISFLLLLFALSFASAAKSAELSPSPIPTTDPTNSTSAIEDEKPFLENGRPVTTPLVYSSPTADSLQGEAFQTTSDSPIITVWNGTTQQFGHNGDPQRWVNILGNVSGPNPITSLHYSLNDGPIQSLNIGPDKRRLTLPGDFIIEIEYSLLQSGVNQLMITADDGTSTPTIVPVTIHYAGGGASWEPGTYTFDWRTATTINDHAQVVTGEWALDSAAGTVRPLRFAYDRLLALGDMNWRDYTVTVPVTIKAIDAGGFPAPSNGPGIGVLVRWRGHFDSNGILPRVGWRELGALAWYRWRKSGGQVTSGMQLLGNGGRVLAENGRPLTFGKRYFFKVNIQSSTNNKPATYRFKMWDANSAEPTGWDFVQVGRKGEPESGSLLLLAHHVDAEFGAVTVQLDSTLDTPPPPPTEETAGTIYITPRKAGTINGIRYSPADILAFDQAAETWSLFFDGSAVGLPAKGIDAFYLNDDGSILLSLFAPGKINGLGKVDDSDIIRFIPTAANSGLFEWYFDGSDVGLTTKAENINAFSFTVDQQLVISTSGKVRVDGVSAVDSDLLLFEANTVGEATSGNWSLYFDGSDVGLTTASEGIAGVWISPDSGDIYLMADGKFSASGVSGAKNDIFLCTPASPGDNTAYINTTCVFEPDLFWRGKAHGFKKPASGLSIELN